MAVRSSARGAAHTFEVDSLARANALVDELRRRGAVVTQLVPHRGKLEDIFVREAAS